MNHLSENSIFRPQLRYASTLNFKNANSPAAFKRSRINDMIKSSKDNNELGWKMENNAKKFLKEATSAFDKIDTERENIKGIHSL